MPSVSRSSPSCPRVRRVSANLALGVVALAVVGAGCRGAVTDPGTGLRIAYDDRGTARPESAAALTRLRETAGTATDVIVFSHGWWNSPDTAECRYRQMIDGMRAKLPAVLKDFRPVLVGIYWPSAVFPPQAGDCEAEGGTGESGGPPPRGEALRARLETWARVAFPAAAARPEFAVEVSRLTRLVEREQGGEPLSREEGESLVAILLAWRDAGRAPIEERPPPDLAGDPRFDEPPSALAARWARAHPTTPGAAGAEAGGRGAGLALSGRWIDWANAFTVWTMKDRAGVVGSRGGYELLQGLQPYRARGLRIHLIGHSFGGKLLSAAITGHGRQPVNVVDSFVILQGAFSHFAFSTAEEIRALEVSTERPGLYADIVAGRRVRGPLVVTHSAFDTPNKVLYPLAFGISGDMLEADQVPRFGSLGANGIQGPTTQAFSLPVERLAARLQPDAPRLVNVNATQVIRAHGDFVKPEVFDLIWDAILAGRQAPR